MHPLNLLAPIMGHREAVVDGDSLEHQHAVAVEYLADRFDAISLPLDFDLTRLQRPCERACESTARCSHHVVERRRLRREVVGGHPIVVGHLRMHPEGDRLLRGGQVGQALRPSQPLDLHP